MKNLSIGQKIIGLSVALLTLMLAASLYSWLQARLVRDAAADFTATLSPLATEAAAVESNIMEQALMLERAVRHQRPGSGDPALAVSEIARFRTLETEVESRLKKAENLIATGLKSSRLIEDAVQLARIEPELAALRREHAEYLKAGLALYDGVLGTPQQVHDLGQRLSTQEDRVDEVLERISATVATASQDEARKLSEREESAYLHSAETLALTLAAFVLGALISSMVTARMVKPVRALIAGVQQVSEGNLDVVVNATTGDEIGKLTLAFQRMIVDLRTKERIKSTFGKYLDPRVVERLLLGDGASGVAPAEKRVMTVFFSDLEGFSGISESLTAAGLVNLINHYLTLASEPIVREQGVIDKYIGDAVMAFWGPPFYADPDHALRACRAALAQQDQLAELRRMLPDILGIRRNLPKMNVRIGLCTGELIVGSIGSNISKSFTVMGDTVNTASRLEGVNKQFGTHVLIDGTTREMVKAAMETRELDYLGVVGKSEPVRVFELLGEKGQVEPARLELRDAFESALAAYRTHDWDQAGAAFQALLTADPEDKAAALFDARVRQFRDSPPPQDWDGVWRLTAK